MAGHPDNGGHPVVRQGALRPRRNDQASFYGSHQGLRPPRAAPTGPTHDRKVLGMSVTRKILASRGPSTHDGRGTEARSYPTGPHAGPKHASTTLWPPPSRSPAA